MRFNTKLSVMAGTILAMTTLATSAALGADPAVTCESGKLKESSKYAACRLKAEAKAVKKGIAADYTKCESKFTDKFTGAETKAGPGVCPSEGDEAAINTRITTDTAEVAFLLTGVRYEDTGLGTVIDHQTGLEWQKTDDAGGLTDGDNIYTWSEIGSNEPDGQTFVDFLFALNDGMASSGSGPTTGCHADRCDWRLPSIEELTTIVDVSVPGCGVSPFNACIDETIFGPTRDDLYWSGTTDAGNADRVWGISFETGGAFTSAKDQDTGARAVRSRP